MKSLVVSIHSSLQDIVFHQILQDIDIDALPDGAEFEAILGDWLKWFYPKIPVSFRLVPNADSLCVAGGCPRLPSSLLLPAFNSSVILLRTRELSLSRLICAPVAQIVLRTALIPVDSANVI